MVFKNALALGKTEQSATEKPHTGKQLTQCEDGSYCTNTARAAFGGNWKTTGKMFSSIVFNSQQAFPLQRSVSPM